VLTIEHGFEGFSDDWRRAGNKHDVVNIRETFSKRGCNVKNLSSPTKRTIRDLAKSEKRLLDLFKPADRGIKMPRRMFFF